jgi:hypothetical protein
MKVCQHCGDEIDTTDGENTCPECERAKEGKRHLLAKRRATRSIKDELLSDLGLVKVRGALGGTYWE